MPEADLHYHALAGAGAGGRHPRRGTAGLERPPHPQRPPAGQVIDDAGQPGDPPGPRRVSVPVPGRRAGQAPGQLESAHPSIFRRPPRHHHLRAGWGRWPIDPTTPATLSASSVLLFLRGSAHPDPQAAPATYRLELDDQIWTVRAVAGQVHVQPGEPAGADASLRTDPRTLNALLENPDLLADAISDGSAAAAGDLPALRRLLRAVTSPAA
jgi:hypothetical protein